MNYRVWLIPGLAFCFFVYSMIFVLLYTVRLSNTRTGLQESHPPVAAKSMGAQSGQQRLEGISQAMKKRLD